MTVTQPLIDEFMRVIGEDVLLLHLSGQSSPEIIDKVAVCTRVLLDEWTVRPWTDKSVEGDRLIALYDAQ